MFTLRSTAHFLPIVTRCAGKQTSYLPLISIAVTLPVVLSFEFGSEGFLPMGTSTSA